MRSTSHDVQIPGTVYLVGGAVREQLRGAGVDTDRDWVVVGATADDMSAAGLTRVGGHFPVFLHPTTGEEYALARIEEKSGEGHKGFTFDSRPHVSIEADLRRRDLTINAIAIGRDETIVDPCNGLGDLKGKILRHVSEAFIEDPLRVYRVARFAALLPDFEIAKETLELMTSMSSDLSTLSAERVWLECAKAMRGLAPHRFFETVNEVGATEPWFRDLTLVSIVGLVRERWLRYANAVASIGWLHDEDVVIKFCRRMKVPGKIFRLVRDVARHGHTLCELHHKSPTDVLRVLQQSQALRPGEAFERLIDAVEACSSIDLSAVRELVQQLKRVRVESATAEEYGPALHNRRVQYIQANFSDLK